MVFLFNVIRADSNHAQDHGTTDRLEGDVLVGVQGPWLLVDCITPILWPGLNNDRVNTVIVLLMQPPKI